MKYHSTVPDPLGAISARHILLMHFCPFICILARNSTTQNKTKQTIHSLQYTESIHTHYRVTEENRATMLRRQACIHCCISSRTPSDRTTIFPKQPWLGMPNNLSGCSSD